MDDITVTVEEALESDPAGLLMTLGTDAMEQIAQEMDKRFREKLLQKGLKLILTAANDDISSPETDAWDNLEFGLESATGDAPAGVYVAFHRKLIPADKVAKKPFDHENDTSMTYLAKDDPEYIHAVQKQQERDNQVIADLEAAYNTRQIAEGLANYPVNVMRPNHNALLEYLETHQVRAILLTLYHSGTANTENPDMSVALLVDKLRKEKGIVFFGVTENGEPVNLRAYETSISLREAGVVPLYDMAEKVAAAKLRLVQPDIKSAELIQEMLKNKVGEIDESQIDPTDIEKLLKLYAVVT